MTKPQGIAHRLDTLAGLGRGLGRASLALATALWTVIAIGTHAGSVAVPADSALLFGFPVAVLALWILLHGGRLERELRFVAAWSVILAAALGTATVISARPYLALVVPVLLITAAACWRYPAAVVLAMLGLVATLGSLEAFIGLRADGLIHLPLAGLALALVFQLTTRRRPGRYVLWPAVFACLLWIGLTGAEVVVSESITHALVSFMTTAWYMLALVLIAYAGWRWITYDRIARGIVLLVGLVAGYAVLRWAIGPAEAEREFATQAAGGINLLPPEGRLRVVGSFGTGHQLAFWAAIAAPFCLAVALTARPRWRAIAGLATMLCIFAALASEARGPLVGMAVGVVTVLVIYALGRSFRVGIGTAMAGAGALVAVGAVAFALTAAGTGTEERYGRIFSPGQDRAYITRQAKWATAMEDIAQRPFGHGLGTAGQAQERHGRYLSIASYSLDNSYLKVAYEQGLAVMAFFILALLLLLLRLSREAIAATQQRVGGLAMGAAGVLASVLVSFFSGLYIETPAVVTAWVLIGVGTAPLVSTRARGGAESPSLTGR